MKLPILWLKDYVKVKSIKDLSHKLTSIGHMLDGRPITSENETILDLEVRQNRSDCLSIIGLAREVSTVTAQPLKIKPQKPLKKRASPQYSVKILDPKLCLRFNSVRLSNLTINNSPKWLVDRLEAYGIKTINSLVDVTNFVMVEYGQPLHAFDLQKLPAKELTIRSAKKNESITVIGNKKIKLHPDDLVISSNDNPTALAGVIGGEDTSVDLKTTEIILEAATYNQANIRRTSIRHSLRTEASTRLEKFLHPKLTEVALLRAIELLKEICGARVLDFNDQYPKKYKEKTITLNEERLNLIAGFQITIKEASQVLRRLGFTTNTRSHALDAVVPYFRTDIEQEDDLIEEVIRIIGYDQVPCTPLSSPQIKFIDNETYLLEEKVRDLMTAQGFDEQITEPLTHEENPQDNPVVLENSLSSDKDMLRTNLKSNLQKGLQERRKHGLNQAKIFEIGKIYKKSGQQNLEINKLGFIISPVNQSYREGRGVVENLALHLNKKISNIKYQISLLDRDTLFVELDINSLLQAAPVSNTAILTSPTNVIKESYSVIFDGNIDISSLLNQIRNLGEEIYSVSLGENPFKIDTCLSLLINIQYKDIKSKNSVLAMLRKLGGKLRT